VHSNIVVSRNDFVETQAESAVVIYATNGVTVERNNLEYSVSPENSIFISNSAGVNVQSNVCSLNGSQQNCKVLIQ